MSSSSSREYSPDWLRNQQAAAAAAATASSLWALSSSSEDEEDDQLPISTVTKKLNNNNKGDVKAAASANEKKEPKTSVWELPSDSEEQTSPSKLNKIITQENDDLKLPQTEPKQSISSSTLPLLLPDKVQRSKVLVECQGESIDLSGDLGSVGRVVISDATQDMLLDLKGTIYKTTIMPSRTLCVVSFGQSEAKIEAIMNDFIQLKPQSNVYEAETMVEGTLEGFSFDSEDEGDKHARPQTDENEGGEPQTNGKSRGKSEAAKKKGKIAVKKPAAKKVNKKKAPVAKKAKAKK